MTTIKERAVEMIQRMPEDNMLYVIHMLQTLETMSADKEKDKQKARKALEDILNMEKKLPEGFDPEKELREARYSDKVCRQRSYRVSGGSQHP